MVRSVEEEHGGGPFLSFVVFEDAFFGVFFPRELREVKVRELLILKQEAMSVQVHSHVLSAIPLCTKDAGGYEE
ncbi:hypothetical protein H5410_056162 [Solanum commersonii]|uniref:Uncharacterized protein n=1 Tax=Solanum commersonii TaxID=4109 RepID=A0A9J5WLG7_SOLCO|nr:hypothetical protein H5410_056162 [Solanum commersonii]